MLAELKKNPKKGLTVIRRCGKPTSFEADRIRQVINWACEGVSVNPLELESRFNEKLTEGITTKKIQETLIHLAFDMCSPEATQWSLVSARLKLWGLYKDVKVARGYGYYLDDKIVPFKKPQAATSYAIWVDHQINYGKYDERLGNYSLEDLEEAGSWIVPDRDKDFYDPAMNLLLNRYLLPNELPQEAILSCALLLALPEKTENRLKVAKQFYDKISLRQLSLATPILANLRVPNGNLGSCFIIAMDDNLESIFREITNTAMISKNGGGVGVNLSRVRATGSWVKGYKNASGGVIPWIALLNGTGVAVNQLGKRAGAITTGIDIWHLDVPEFLEMQTENGDQRRKAYDVFPQLILPDEFMRRVINKETWTLVDPYEVRTNLGIELADLWGEEFEKAYQLIESELGKKITLYKRINARELFKSIMRSQVETGMPYLAFKDTINRANPNKHEGIIPQVNLCVAPETKILTDRGQFQIDELVGEYVNIWNGFEWSEVLIKKTGENQPLLRVHFSNGETLDCTYYHKFHVKNNYKSNEQIIDAQDLSIGDKLIKYDLSPISWPDDIDFPYAYTSGFFSGDGSYGGKANYPEIDLYGEKKELLPHLTIRNKYVGGGSGLTQWRIETNEQAIYYDTNGDRIVCKLPLDIPAKFTVPLNGYTLQSRLDWLAGLLDADGTVCRNGENESLQIGSVNKQFLLDIRLMLQTLGVDSKVTNNQPAGYRKMPDGKGGLKEYFCQPSYRLLISSSDLYQLSQLGLKTNRLKWSVRKPQRNASQFIQVTKIEHTGRISDTYCFTEPKRHLGMFNGILTGQCTESFSNVSTGNLAHSCNLTSINLANTEFEELAEICSLAVRLLDNTIELTEPPFPDAKAHNNRYRTIGVGCMGLADWLAKRGLKYRDLNEIDRLFEEAAYHCTKTSMELAKERGSYGAFEGSEWYLGNIGNILPSSQKYLSDPNSRWSILREDIMKFGIRNSHITAIAPNTSSSLVQGCTASFLPTYKRFYIDKNGKGANIISIPFPEYLWFYEENVRTNQKHVVAATSTIQGWIDTGISMELLFDLNEGVYFPDEPERCIQAKDIYETLIMAWELGCKAVYYFRTVQKDNFKGDSCESCAN